MHTSEVFGSSPKQSHKNAQPPSDITNIDPKQTKRVKSSSHSGFLNNDTNSNNGQQNLITTIISDENANSLNTMHTNNTNVHQTSLKSFL